MTSHPHCPNCTAVAGPFCIVTHLLDCKRKPTDAEQWPVHVESGTGRGTRTIVRGRRLRAENFSEEARQ